MRPSGGRSAPSTLQTNKHKHTRPMPRNSPITTQLSQDDWATTIRPLFDTTSSSPGTSRSCNPTPPAMCTSQQMTPSRGPRSQASTMRRPVQRPGARRWLSAVLLSSLLCGVARGFLLAPAGGGGDHLVRQGLGDYRCSAQRSAVSDFCAVWAHSCETCVFVLFDE